MGKPTQEPQTVRPGFARLPVAAATYDHAAGQLQFVFSPDQVLKGRVLVLTDPEGNSRAARTRKLADKAGDPAQVVAIFRQVWLRDLAEPLILATADRSTKAPAVFLYRAGQHEVLHWSETAPNRGTLTMLLSFPRSGSNFLQHIIRSNSTQVGCASIYQVGRRLHDPKLCMKSHALDTAILQNELKAMWGIQRAPRRRIVLTRDPRDMFISLYDYVAGLRQTQVAPKAFLATDFYWYLFRPHVLEAIRDPAHARARSVLQA